MSRTEGPTPSTIFGHPMALPTLFVVGGWALLVGGYIPSQAGRQEAAGPSASNGPPPPYPYPYPSAVPYPYAYPYPAPPPEQAPAASTVIDNRAGDGPLRLTIELPNRSGESASVVINDSRSDPAPEDREATRTASRMAPRVEPPPIPGPPPGFDPMILSPLLPESVPLSTEHHPILGGKARPAALLAQPFDELPASFEPKSPLERHREGLETGEDPGPIREGSSADSLGDRAPAPPMPPTIDPMGDLERDLLASRPKPIEILPDPEPEPLPEPAPPAPAVFVAPEPIAVQSDSQAERKGVFGRLFGKKDRGDLRRSPSLPAAPSPEAIAYPMPQPGGPTTPSDVLAQTDWIFRGGPPPEQAAPTSAVTPTPTELVTAPSDPDYRVVGSEMTRGRTTLGAPPSDAVSEDIMTHHAEVASPASRPSIEAPPALRVPGPIPVAEAPTLGPIVENPIEAAAIPSPTSTPIPGTGTAVAPNPSRSRSNSGLVRMIGVPIPKIDRTLLPTESAAAAAPPAIPGPAQEASIDPE